MGDPLPVELAGRDFEHESSERYREFIVRTRIKRILNKAVKSNAIVSEEEIGRFSRRYVDSFKFPDGRVLRSNCEMRDAFRVHFQDRFSPYPDHRFRSFAAI